MKTQQCGNSLCKRAAAVLILALAVIGTSCQTTTPAPVEGWQEVRGQSFTLWRPKDIQIGREPTTDFNYLYLFEPPKKDEKPPTMYIYEGFNPKMFHKEKQGLTTRRSGDVRIGAFQGLEAAGTDGNGNYWRELHLRQPDQLATLHIWYFEQTKEKAALFDSIVRTLQIRLRGK